MRPLLSLLETPLRLMAFVALVACGGALESPAASPAADADTDTDPPECSTRTPICSGGECEFDVAVTPRTVVGEQVGARRPATSPIFRPEPTTS